MSELVEVKTIGEVERIVHASGLWDGTGPVEFSDDGETWRETWAPTSDRPFPEYARVTVYRKEVRVPTTVTIRWDEQVPTADPFWAAKWANAPMRHFGRTVRMVAFRQTFRELLGDMVLEDEDRSGRETTAPAEAPEPAPRDWAAEIAAAADAATLDEIDAAARKARVFTPDAAGTALHRALRSRRAELTTSAAAPIAGQRVEMSARQSGKSIRMPSDYQPPANRAARRKKGRR
ncbi:hypothetical protein [Microbacterium stercoris]|uniref:Uncharacterized protein n=1 Tax=Microbacterium stercoris TaxID=2820289 RepID=A0A939TQQ6_9MICO|nr:hypothetical protein [Microbacterium stercoris]MBO3663705.1 hypothetical protein [Microbacterium stercoris]